MLKVNIGQEANDGTGDQLRTAFGKVNSSIEGLEEAVGRISEVEEWVNDTGKGLGSKVDDLETKVDAIGPGVAETLEELQVTIDGVRNDVTIIDGKVTAVRADLTAEVTALESEIENVRNDASVYIDGKVLTEKVERQSEIDSLSARITELSAALVQDDLLTNGSFGDGTNGWVRTGTGTVEPKNESSPLPIIANMPSTFAASIEGAGDGLLQETDTFDFKTSDMLQFRFYAASTAVSREIEVRIRWFNVGGGEITPATAITLTLTGANLWRSLSERATPPAGARKASFGIFKTQTGAFIWLTRVQASIVNTDIEARVAELEAAKVTQESALATLKTTTEARFGVNETALTNEAIARANGDSAAATRLTAVEATNTEQQAGIQNNATAIVNTNEAIAQLDTTISATFAAAELVQDGTFARGFAKWPDGNLGSVVLKSTELGNLASEMPAAQALDIRPVTSDPVWRRRLTARMPCAASERLVAAFAYIRESTGVVPRMIIVFSDATGVPLPSATSVVLNGVTAASASWQVRSVELVVPVGAAFVACGFERFANVPGTTRCLVTNVSLQRMQGFDFQSDAAVKTLTQAQADTNASIASIQTTIVSNYTDLDTRTRANAEAITNVYTKTQTDSAISGQITTVNSSLATTTAIANGKGKTIYQNAVPAVADRLAQNLWIDTTGGANTPKRWNGTSWVAVSDKVATDTASAVTALTTEVNSVKGTVTAQGTAVTLTQAQVDRLRASGMLRMVAVGTPTSAETRVALVAEVSDGVASGSAAIFLLAATNGVNTVDIVASRLRIVNDTTANAAKTAPFRVEGGVVYMDTAMIKDAEITGAKIKDADIGTLKLQGNAVTIPVSQYLATRISGTNTWVTASQVTIRLDERAHVTAIWTASQEYESGSRATGTRLAVNGTIQSLTQAGVFSDYAVQSWAGYLNAGTHIIRVDWLGDHNSVYLENRTLIVTGSKR